METQGKRVSDRGSNKFKAMRKNESETLMFEEEIAGQCDGI